MGVAGTRPAWSGQAANGGHWRAVGQREIAAAIANVHEQRQIAVGTQGADAQLAQVMAVGRLLTIDQADEGLAAHVGRAGAVAPLFAGKHAWFAAHDVVRLVTAIARWIAHGIERQETLVGAGAVTGHTAQRVDLEIRRPGAVSDHVVLVDPVAQVDPVDTAREQIDRRSTEGHELLDADAAFQRLVVALEQHDQLQLLPVATFYRATQLGELDEQETLRQSEVFLQQAVTLERLRDHRQGCLAVIEAARAQGRGRNALDPVAAGLAREHRTGVAQQLLIKAKRQFIGAVEVQRQAAEVERVERQLGAGTQGNAQPGAGFRFTGGKAPEVGCGIAEVFGLGHLQRPQRDRVGTAKFTGRLRIAAKGGAQHAATGQGETSTERTFVRIGLHLHHGHRRRRCQVVRVGDLQQVVGEGRVLGIELELYPCGQVGKTFEQTLDIGVGAVNAGQGQTPGDLRVFPGEFCRAFTDVLQFLVVQLEQARVHGRLRRSAGATRTCPDSRSRSVRSSNGSAAGWAHRSPSISKLRALLFISPGATWARTRRLLRRMRGSKVAMAW
ncbi:hypothetical protein D3C80_730420 [compost metagenome]